MSDRQISVRVGKAFWSRGPSNMSPSDLNECFESRDRSAEGKDEAAVFQANYELTQLFSNAHDILYASRDHRDRLFSSGDYAKYLVCSFRDICLETGSQWIFRTTLGPPFAFGMTPGAPSAVMHTSSPALFFHTNTSGST